MCKAQGAVIQQSGGVKFRNHLPKQCLSSFRVKFALVPGNDSIFRVDEDKGRPCFYGVLLPEMLISIIYDRMIYAVA